MKLVLLLSLLGVTVVSAVFLDGGRRRPYNSFDSSSSESWERERRRRTRRPRPPPPPPPTPCPSDWITFDRPQGRWCVKVFTGNIDWNSAQTKCLSLGATLTGVQDDTERMAVADEGRRLLQLNRLGDASIWLGGTRRSECPRANICQPQDTFEWVDGFTTGNAAMVFPNGQPDGLFRGSIVQACIQQFIFPYADTSSVWPGFHHGMFDDQYCSETSGPRSRLYACGRRP